MTFNLPIEPLNLIPDHLKTRLIDNLITYAAQAAEKMSHGTAVSHQLKKLKSDAPFHQAIDAGLQAATERFIREYMPIDEDLVTAIAGDPHFWQAQSVRTAVLDIIQNPTLYLKDQHLTLSHSFVDVLRQRINRERVDSAVTYYLHCVVESLWHIAEIRPIYELQMQRMSLENMNSMVQELRGLRTDLQQSFTTLIAEANTARLMAPTTPMLSQPKPFHNLPQRDFGRFIGRTQELKNILRILRPYPHSQHSVVTIDGIGGVGKSTLALEIAHRYRHQYNRVPPEERFEAIIWASAKQTILTAEGIQTRHQILRTLQDIYNAIGITLKLEQINQANHDLQSDLVRQTLSQQRTLLIIDNLETVDDEAVLTFLRELPAPTKAIVTTRHRIDIAYPIRLRGMSWEEAQLLINHEAEKRSMALDASQMERLYNHTGGIPLAIVWSIAQIGFGYSVDAVLNRLGQPNNDIIKFCFQASLNLIKDQPAHKLLQALALFVPDGSREALGRVAALSELERDDGLVTLEKLSLVNKTADRFSLLPVTKTLALAELNRDPEVALQFGRSWIDYFQQVTKATTTLSEYYWRHINYDYLQDTENLLAAIDWSFEYGQAHDVFILSVLTAEYLEVTGKWNSSIELLRKALRLAQSINDKPHIARFSQMLSWIFYQQGRFEEGLQLLETALEIYQQTNNFEGIGFCLQRKGCFMRKYGKNMQEARRLQEAALAIANKINDEDLKYWVKTADGKLARDTQNYELAWKLFSEIQIWFEEKAAETPRDETLALSIPGHLANIAIHLGRPQEAKELLNKSLNFFTTNGSKSYYAMLKYWLALANEVLGEYQASLTNVNEAIYWFERLSMKPDLLEAYALQARLQKQNNPA